MSDPNLAVQRQIQELHDTLERLRKADSGPVSSTFTPSFSGSGTAGSWTYSVQTGFYTRIGNRILFNLSVAVTAVTVAPTGNAWITGLPINSVSTSDSHSAVAIDTISGLTLTGTIVQLTGRVPPNSTRVELIEVTGTGPSGASFLAATGLIAGSFLRISGHYMV